MDENKIWEQVEQLKRIQKEGSWPTTRYTKKQKTIRKQIRKISRISKEELKEKILAIENQRDRALFATIYAFALRQTESTSLCVRDITEERMEGGLSFILCHTITLKQRGRRDLMQAVVPWLVMPDEQWLADIVLGWKKHVAETDPNKEDAKLFKVSTSLMRKLCKGAVRKRKDGTYTTTKGYFGVNLHSLRHWRAMHLKKFMGARELQMFMRHKSPASTLVYAHMEMSDVKRAWVQESIRKQQRMLERGLAAMGDRAQENSGY